jgi:hypothetical protein
VHSIVMSSNALQGELPLSLSSLTMLRMVELAQCAGLTGSIRGMCSLPSLRRLCICRCSLKGPIPNEIGKLINLEELQLYGNNFSGRIPSSLSCLQSLKLLSLGEYTGGNRFEPRPMPDCLSSLSMLEALFLANCR